MIIEHIPEGIIDLSQMQERGFEASMINGDNVMEAETNQSSNTLILRTAYWGLKI